MLGFVYERNRMNLVFLLLHANPAVTSLEDFEQNPEPLGRQQDVIAALTRAFPGTQWRGNTGTWEDGRVMFVSFSIDSEEPVHSVRISVHARNKFDRSGFDHLARAARVLSEYHWQLFNTDTNDALPLAPPQKKPIRATKACTLTPVPPDKLLPGELAYDYRYFWYIELFPEEEDWDILAMIGEESTQLVGSNAYALCELALIQLPGGEMLQKISFKREHAAFAEMACQVADRTGRKIVTQITAEHFVLATGEEIPISACRFYTY
ncbi:MAG: hypothetical protein ACYDCO_13525 [Armatimonadota bacterium]